jgi:hypothetical protein
MTLIPSLAHQSVHGCVVASHVAVLPAVMYLRTVNAGAHSWVPLAQPQLRLSTCFIRATVEALSGKVGCMGSWCLVMWCVAECVGHLLVSCYHKREAGVLQTALQSDPTIYTCFYCVMLEAVNMCNMRSKGALVCAQHTGWRV